ncbi:MULTISPECIES: hypothetical protein [Bacillaceae]|uniref:Uncharacterized protein n=1 Tax=Evansella alkalicola TaxID=745819 RepID=A0ABS6JYV2_9BACI|nr:MULTISPECIES: hypothetical protein [Bacillaceae]MBU9723771.1 hypothetical protein [Bacillus alkalicola]
MLLYTGFIIIPLLLYHIGVQGKSERTRMEKMMLAMGASMLICFTVGIYVGGLFQGVFFSSIVLSIFISVFFGLFIGIPHGPLATVEGVFTGAMAGLMGAMTAEMLSIAEIRIILLFFLLLSGLGGFWSIHFWKNNEKSGKKKWIFLHILTLLYLICIAVLFVWYPPFQGQENIGGHHM